jgi:hypothetical protein
MPADRLQVGGEMRVNNCVKNSGGTAIAGTCSSDLRLKRDITPFPLLLDKVVRLRPVNYYWRSSEYSERHFGNEPSYGLIAQEVERVLPELVSTDEQGYKSVNYSKLPLLTLQAVKELKAENDTLKEKLQKQQAEIAALKTLVCKSAPDADICKQ